MLQIPQHILNSTSHIEINQAGYEITTEGVDSIPSNNYQTSQIMVTEGKVRANILGIIRSYVVTTMWYGILDFWSYYFLRIRLFKFLYNLKLPF